MKHYCSRCHAELREGVSGQRCAKCLLELGLHETAADALPDAGVTKLENSPMPNERAADAFPDGRVPELFRPERLGNYDLLEEIARGGMGIVLKARQRSLNRTVALKLILSGQFASKQEVLRFRAEAEAAANLRHPNIVAVYETGEHQGQHYFSMEYVQGRDLAAIVRDGPLAGERAARYVQPIAQAIHYAHQQGTLHRDLKPSNVLIDADDRPRITDFGLAKRLEGDSSLTLTGQTLGSPNFMAPEQTSSRHGRISAKSDVYGIGALLYHLLVGRPPFQAATIEDVLRDLQANEPVSPHLLNPSVPRDLETICLKCLEKEPGKRYATAQEVADELGRFLGHEPIHARPITWAGRLWRWCRRKPVLTGLVGALLFAILFSTTAIAWQLRRVAQAAQSLRRRVYASDVNAAFHALTQTNLDLATDLLKRHIPRAGEADLREFVWRYLWDLAQGDEFASLTAHDAEVHAVAVSMNGLMATVGFDRAVKLWDVGTREFKKTLGTFPRRLGTLALSPNGQTLAAGDGKIVRVWDVLSGSLLKELAPVEGVFFFLPQSGALVAKGTNGVRIWDPKTWQNQPLGSTNSYRAASSQDEHWLAVAESNVLPLEVHLLDASRQRVGKLEGQLRNPVYALAFSPDAKLIVARGMEGELMVWDRETRRLLTNFQAQANFTVGLAFSGDGHLLASSGGGDDIIRVWSVSDWRNIAQLKGHHNGVWGLTFAPEGQTLISASRDHTVKFWRIQPASDNSIFVPAESLIDFTARGAAVITLARDATLQQWSPQSVRPTTSPLRVATNKVARTGAVSSDGHQVAIGYDDGSIEIRELATGQLRHELSGGTNATDLLRFSPDGLLAARNRAPPKAAMVGAFTLWNTRTGASLPEVPTRVGGLACSFEFSHQERWLAVGLADDSILIWDLARRRELLPPIEGHTYDVVSLAFSPDDQTLASASWDTTVRLWDVTTGREKRFLPGHKLWAGYVSFSPDGQTLATAAGDDVVRLWHVTSGQEMLVLQPSRMQSRMFTEVRFSPDGNTLAASWQISLFSAPTNSSAQLWRAPSLREIDAARARGGIGLR